MRRLLLRDAGIENVRMPVTQIWQEPESFPEGRAPGTSIHRNPSCGATRLCKQRRDKHAPDTAMSERLPHVEAAHPNSVRQNWFSRQATNAGKSSVQPRCQQCLASTVEAGSARQPVVGEPLHHTVAFGMSFGAQYFEAFG